MLPLKDALYNFHPDSGSDATYCKGLFVGVVATVMQIRQIEFDDAVHWLAANGYFPDQIDYEKVPNTLKSLVRIAVEKQ